jgi:hypothetical protein
MGQQPSPADEALYRRTDEVLHYLWDPIGVAGIPGARDEYDVYLPQLFSLLKGGAGIEAIADYLFDVTTQSIGLGGRCDRDRQIAETLIEWRIAILGS